MKKILISICLIVSLLVFGISREGILEVMNYYNVNEDRAVILTDELFNNSEGVDPEIMLALMISEGGIKNVIGDHGEAMGYFQLHDCAIEYVTRFYPDVLEFYNSLNTIDDLLKFPAMQVKIACRYMYCLQIFVCNGNLLKALNLWNNSENYYLRIFKIIIFIHKNILREGN